MLTERKVSLYFYQNIIMSSPSISVGVASRLKNSGSLVRLPALPMSARRLMIVIATEFTPLSPLTFFFFDDEYVGKQPTSWKK